MSNYTAITVENWERIQKWHQDFFCLFWFKPLPLTAFPHMHLQTGASGCHLVFTVRFLEVTLMEKTGYHPSFKELAFFFLAAENGQLQFFYDIKDQ